MSDQWRSQRLDQFFAANRPPSKNWRVPSSYSTPRLVYAINHAKLHPNDTYTTPHGSKMTAAEYVLWFRRCLRDKIYSFDRRAVRGRKTAPAYSLSLYRDSQRLKGYGGFGKILETTEIRKRLDADHVHFFWGGGHRLCGDENCENRR